MFRYYHKKKYEVELNNLQFEVSRLILMNSVIKQNLFDIEFSNFFFNTKIEANPFRNITRDNVNIKFKIVDEVFINKTTASPKTN